MRVATTSGGSEVSVGVKRNRTFFRTGAIALCAALAAASMTARADLTVDNLSVTKTAVVAQAFTVMGTPPPASTNNIILTAFTNGLVGYWPLDGDGTDLAAGHTGTIDSSSIALGGGQQKIGTGAYNINGTPILVPGFACTGTTYTVSAWVSTTSSDQGMYIFYPAGANPILAFSNAGSAGWPYELAFYDASDGWQKFGIAPLNDGAWHLVVMVCDGDSEEVTAYVDGTQQGDVLSWTPVGLASGEAHIGESDYSSDSFDDVAVWNRALSSGEVTTLYNNGPANTNILVTAGSSNILFNGDTFIKTLVPQGDVDMGSFTSRP